MTRWQFDDGSSVETVADGNSSVTYVVSSLSTDYTGVYYCEAIIDGMTNTSMNHTLFGEHSVISRVHMRMYLKLSVFCMHVCVYVCVHTHVRVYTMCIYACRCF